MNFLDVKTSYEKLSKLAENYTNKLFKKLSKKINNKHVDFCQDTFYTPDFNNSIQNKDISTLTDGDKIKNLTEEVEKLKSIIFEKNSYISYLTNSNKDKDATNNDLIKNQKLQSNLETTNSINLEFIGNPKVLKISNKTVNKFDKYTNTINNTNYSNELKQDNNLDINQDNNQDNNQDSNTNINQTKYKNLTTGQEFDAEKYSIKITPKQKVALKFNSIREKLKTEKENLRNKNFKLLY